MTDTYQGFRRVSAGPGSHEPANTPLARDAGKGAILYLDALSGVAGDMLVAALLDLGVPMAVIEHGLQGLRALGVDGYSLRVQVVSRASIRALHFEVSLQGATPQRDYASIRKLLQDASSLTLGARTLALNAFERLALAEAQIHGVPLERVHFHEVGAVDSIVDVVAAAIGFDYLGARVCCSPLPMGRGLTRTAHGVIPLPAPATVLCLQGVPTYDAGIDAELVTPTGACLVAAVSSEYGGWPAMRPLRSGFGAGTRELADRPNLVRAVLGMPDAQATDRPSSRHVVIEANVDDSTGEVVAYALSRALEAGALDAWATPIVMKKGRPAVTLSVLAAREQLQAVATVLLSETTSLGVRFHGVDRLERPRRMINVDTSFGTIAIKVADGDGLPEQVAPEYESCRQAAAAHHVPIKQVYAAALTAYAALTGRS
jgi:uncharacterized protein (TIGR00299 family) protein